MQNENPQSDARSQAAFRSTRARQAVDLLVYYTPYFRKCEKKRFSILFLFSCVSFVSVLKAKEKSFQHSK
ncbi:MAG: hypothetical protein J6Q02_02670, partial [Lachnospiraceae bacterium]|nr:hypothetical protein [Lachnospiraceae bacterium]